MTANMNVRLQINGGKDLKLSRDIESLMTKDEKSGASKAGHDANRLEDLPAKQFSLGSCWIGSNTTTQMLPVTGPSSSAAYLTNWPSSTTPFDISLQCPALPPTTPGSMFTFTATARPHLPLPSTARTKDANEAGERWFSGGLTGSESGRCCLKWKREMS